MRPGKRKRQRRKKRSWTLVSILGLGLSAIGAVGIIELRPQIAVSPQELTNKQLPFSAPFRIDNTGYFGFQVERVFFYIRALKAGPVLMRDYIQTQPSWNHKALERGEGETIVSNVLDTRIPPEQADIAVVVEYKPWRWFPVTFRRYFRFEQSEGPHFESPYMGAWQWEKQPVSEIKADIEREIGVYDRDKAELR
jgi:hypothetical protein